MPEQHYSLPREHFKALQRDALPAIPERVHWRSQDNYRRLHLPYCFTPVSSEAHIYLPLNRFYKPLGMHGVWVDYRAFPEIFVRFSCNPHSITNVWWCNLGRGNSRGLYLYYDNRDSMKDYGERYARLLQFVDTDTVGVVPGTVLTATATVMAP
jgi:hypothetical protein